MASRSLRLCGWTGPLVQQPHGRQTTLVGDTGTPLVSAARAPSARARPTCPQCDRSRRGESLVKGSVACGQRSPSRWAAGGDCPPGVTVHLEVSRDWTWAGQGGMEGPWRGPPPGLLVGGRASSECRWSCVSPRPPRGTGHPPPRPLRVSLRARLPGSESGRRRLWVLARPRPAPLPLQSWRERQGTPLFLKPGR